jgi:hypothetical protein
MQVDTPNKCVCRKSEHEHGVSMLPDIYDSVRAYPGMTYRSCLFYPPISLGSLPDSVP